MFRTATRTAVLNLLVRVDNEFALGVIDKTHRWPHLQLPASGAAQDSALQSCLKHMQFGFTHGALQAK